MFAWQQRSRRMLLIITKQSDKRTFRVEAKWKSDRTFRVVIFKRMKVRSSEQEWRQWRNCSPHQDGEDSWYDLVFPDMSGKAGIQLVPVTGGIKSPICPQISSSFPSLWIPPVWNADICRSTSTRLSVPGTFHFFVYWAEHTKTNNCDGTFDSPQGSDFYCVVWSSAKQNTSTLGFLFACECFLASTVLYSIVTVSF